ncbi:MAG: PLP-dependent aspartate aminotransferase family protein [Bacteroidota bacterium]
MSNSISLESRSVHDPEVHHYNAPHQVPLVAASSFCFDSIQQGMAIFDGEEPGHIYGRFGNPTIDAAAQKIADMEAHGTGQTAKGLFCSSGMAAIATAILGVLDGPGRVLTAPDLYGGTVSLLQQMEKQGVELITCDLRDLEAVEQHLRKYKNIKLIYCETPANPTLKITDLKGLANLSHAAGAKLIVDNTFATPMVQQPIALGADVVLHSTTKYLNGHGTGVAGALVTTDAALFSDRFVPIYRLYGGSGNAWDAWLVLNGLKTLPIRMERHAANALAVARWLVEQPLVELVNYPGLENHPQRQLAARQMRSGGGMLSFSLRGGTEAAYRFMNSIDFCTLTPTLGDVDTLVLHPASMSHRGLDPEVRRAQGIPDGLIRLSVGIETVGDIIADLEQAINAS